MITSFFLLCVSLISCTFSTNYYSSGSGTLCSTKKISVMVNVSDSDDLVTVTMVGPSSVYYSVGFDSCKMKNAFAFVVPGTGEDDDSVVEYILGDDSAGSQLDTTFTTISDVDDGSYRTVSLTRSLSDQDDLSDDYYAFDSSTTKLEIIWAYGSKGKYSQHDEAAAGCVKVKFDVEVDNSTSSLMMDAEEENVESVEMMPFSWGQLFSSNLSYIYGQHRISLIVVLALLSSIMVYAAFHCYLRSRNPYKMIVDEAKPLMDTAVEEGFRIV